MKRKISLLMVMLLAFTMIISTTAISVSAETTYTPIGGTATFVKYLVVDSDSNIPDVEFLFDIKRGAHKDATATTVEILQGIRANIGTADFSNDDTANCILGLPTDTDRTNPTAGKKFAQKTVTVTFPENSFNCPGVYRYEITELSTNPLPGVVYDSNPTRYLDVFVLTDDNNALSIDSFVLSDTLADIGLNGEYVTENSVKSSGYTNELTQYDFEFSKTISGNQGDKNKRFKFTLNISNANPGTYPVLATDVTDDPTFITVPEGGTSTHTFYLTNGSSVQILGLNKDAKCTVTENEQDYTPSYKIDNGAVASGNSSGVITLANDDHSVAFTNTRNGIIPTGVIVAVAPFAVGILVFGAVLIFIVVRRKRRPY